MKVILKTPGDCDGEPLIRRWFRKNFTALGFQQIFEERTKDYNRIHNRLRKDRLRPDFVAQRQDSTWCFVEMKHHHISFDPKKYPDLNARVEARNTYANLYVCLGTMRLDYRTKPYNFQRSKHSANIIDLCDVYNADLMLSLPLRPLRHWWFNVGLEDMDIIAVLLNDGTVRTDMEVTDSLYRDVLAHESNQSRETMKTELLRRLSEPQYELDAVERGYAQRKQILEDEYTRSKERIVADAKILHDTLTSKLEILQSLTVKEPFV